jgi:hypothetical protein
MRRSPQSLLAWSAALLVAVITIVVVFSDLATLHRRRAISVRRVRCSSRRMTSPRCHARASDVRKIALRGQRPANAVVDVDDAIGRVVAVPVLAGSVLLEPHLTERDRDGLSRLVTIQVPGRTSVPTTGCGRPSAPSSARSSPSIRHSPNAARGQIVARAARVLGRSRRRCARRPEGGVTLLVTEDEARSLHLQRRTAS